MTLSARDKKEKEDLKKLDALRLISRTKKLLNLKDNSPKLKPGGRKATEDKRRDELDKLRKKYLDRKKNKKKTAIITSIPKAKIITISVDRSGIPESKAILKAFKEFKKLLKMD